MEAYSPDNYFEAKMQEGLAAHRRADFVTALSDRFDAFYADPPRLYDHGRAARDIASTFDRLGDTNLGGEYKYPVDNSTLADAYAEYAVREHETLKDASSPGAAREFTVSAMVGSIIAARQGRGEDATSLILDGWRVGTELRQQNGKPHQYDVNMAARVVGIVASFNGKLPDDVYNLPKQLILFAKISETKDVIGFNQAMSREEVAQAQKKAKQRSLAALTIWAFGLSPTRKITAPLERRILNKVVL